MTACTHTRAISSCVHGLGALRNSVCGVWCEILAFLFWNPWRARPRAVRKVSSPPFSFETRCVRAPRTPRTVEGKTPLCLRSGEIRLSHRKSSTASRESCRDVIILLQFKKSKLPDRASRVNAGGRSPRRVSTGGGYSTVWKPNPACRHTFGFIPPLFIFQFYFSIFLRSARAGTDNERISVVGRISSAPDRLAAMRERHYTGYGYIHPPQTYSNRPPPPPLDRRFCFCFRLRGQAKCLLAWLDTCKDSRNTRARRSLLPL